MAPEAELLSALDRLTDAIFSGGPPLTGCDDRLRLAGALDLQETREAVSQLIAAIGAGDDAEPHLDRIHHLAETELARRLAPQQGPEIAAREPAMAEFLGESGDHLEKIEAELLALEACPSNIEPVHAIFRGYHTIKGLAGIAGATAVRDLAHELETVVDQLRNQKLSVSPAVIDVLLKQTDRLRSRLLEAPDAPLPAAAFAAPKPAPRNQETAAVKVETAKLDQLVDLAGEIVIAQAMVRMSPCVAGSEDTKLAAHIARLTQLTSQLQRAALAMRVVPVGGAFQRLSRAFRDLAREAGKDARLETAGEDAELDRNILEQLADPLLHMVRNAVDHGLETPAERVAAGKPAQGVVRLAAAHHSGHIVIEVSDDGRGLNGPAILARARERGLVAPEAVPGPNELLDLIFLPGFSTAGTVSELSGRGVGMDVVRLRIQQLRGKVEVRSAAGRGTSFLLRLPLTLAIIDGLLVRAGTERYILPMFAVREIFAPQPEAIRTIATRHQVIRVRERTFPLVNLREKLRRPPPPAGEISQPVVVVIDWNGEIYGLLADELIGKQEVVIKSIGEWLGHLPGISGAAILADGEVGLILDPEGLLGGRVYAAA
ncbi:MAG: chemotaxis protein CheA [Bryobacteraceae bacterium]|nr:chemotaxis protein CheA [Bryobacteraceae bacterium]